jgi:hypothetical protein
VLVLEVRPEYLKKVEKIRKERIIRIGSAGDFRKKYGLK